MVKTLKLFSPKRVAVAKPREHRGNRHQRGYDYEWTKTSANHLRRFPLCAECDRDGRTVMATVVDHKIPVRHRPDLRLDRQNHWSLCDHCHNGMKRRLEAIAERLGQIDQLIRWCDDPASRPAAIKHDRRPSKQEMVV